jgi:hypothetical protein
VTAEIPLTGLAGSHPLGALAAFGLLRCCDELDGFRGARLGWRPPDWHAVLEAEQPRGLEELVESLAARQKRRPEAPELNWANSIKVGRDAYLDALRAAGEDLQKGGRRRADFLASFACELCGDDGGRLEPTAFYMTSGRQEFLKEARALAARVAAGVRLGRRTKGPEELFREALAGPWRYEDPQHSLGWDPSAERLHALRARSPTKEPSEGVTAAVWLAFEALPLFPCFLSGGRLATTGFHTRGATRKDRTTSLTWPVWERPVPLDTVRSLLSLPELSEERPPAKGLGARGVGAAFRSERYRVKTQGAYYILRPAYPVL